MAIDKQLVELLNKQTEILNRLASKEAGETVTKTPANFSTYTPLHGPGGIFTTPGLEPDLITAHVRPHGIDGILRLLPTVNVDESYGIVTGFTPGDTNDSTYWLTTHCGDVPAGYMKACVLTSRFGTLRVDSQTIDFDDVMLKLHRGDFTDLMLHGEVLGMTGLNPSDTNETDILNLVSASEMVQMGVQTERLLNRAIWQGAVANNQFPGLANQVATGQVDKETNTACPAADSDVKDFALDQIGGAGRDIVEYLSMLEYYLRYNSQAMGLDPVDWVIAMRPELWFELTSIWPCAYNTTKCSPAVIGGSSRVFLDGRENTAERDRMRQSMTIDINGISYRVITDTGIFEHNNINNANLNPGQYASSIFMIPLTVRGGLPVTYRQYLDFRAGQTDLAYGRGNLQIWNTDNGLFSWTVEQTKWCYKFSLKSTQRVVLRAPHMAGRIDNVMYTPLQHLREPNPNDPYFLDGGVSLRGTPQTFNAVWA